MKCKEVMTADPVCCDPDDSAAQIAKLMKTEDVGSLPICEDRQSKKLIGIVTDRDLAMNVVAEGKDSNSVKARDVMTREPVTCRADDDIQRAFEAMERHQVRRIPVVDQENCLIGIIAQADVANRCEAKKTAEVVQEISRPGIAA